MASSNDPFPTDATCKSSQEFLQGVRSLGTDASSIQKSLNTFFERLHSLQKSMEVQLNECQEREPLDASASNIPVELPQLPPVGQYRSPREDTATSRESTVCQEARERSSKIQSQPSPLFNRNSSLQTFPSTLVIGNSSFPAALDEDQVPQIPPALLLSSRTKHALSAGHSAASTASFPSYSSYNGGDTLLLHGFWEEVHTHAGDQRNINPGEGYAKYTSLAHGGFSRRNRHSKNAVSERLGINLGCCESFLYKLMHPHSIEHVVWSAIGLVLVIYDTVQVPISLAWGLEVARHGWQWILFMFGFVFWNLDLPLNFVTGFYKEGELVMDVRKTTKRYACSWLIVDLFLLGSDYSTFFMKAEGLSTMKIIRIVRAARILRIMKASMFMSYVEDVCSASALQFIFFTFMIIKILAFVLVSTHVLSCIWYSMGLADGWVVFYDVDEWPRYNQYLVSLHWVLGHLASGPEIVPTNAIETMFGCFIIFYTLLILGGAVSKISATIAEISSAREEKSKKMRTIKQYMKDQQLPIEIRSRVIKFVDYALSQYGDTTLDPELVPISLRTEIMMTQRGPLLQTSPLFALLQNYVSEIFCEICQSLQNETHPQTKHIFTFPDRAEAMWITVSGKFLHCGQNADFDSVGKVVSLTSERGTFHRDAQWITGTHHFGEIALYAANFFHKSRLIAAEVTHTFSLTGQNLAEVVRNHLVSCETIYHYAHFILKSVQRNSEFQCELLDGQLCEQAVESTLLHQMINLPIDLRIEASERGIYEFLQREMNLDVWNMPSLARAETSATTSKTYTLFEEGCASKSLHLSRSCSSCASLPSVWPDASSWDFVKNLRSEAFSLSHMELPEEFQRMFNELHSKDGVYVRMKQEAERNRILCSLISVVYLIRNDYGNFTHQQDVDERMTREVWDTLQELVAWTDLDENLTVVIFAFIVVRGLGKSAPLVAQLPISLESAEQTVLYIVERCLHLVPSIDGMKADQGELFKKLRSMLVLHTRFNLAQFLQAENSPANVWLLKATLEHSGVQLLKLYLFSVVGMMSGLAAGGGGSTIFGSKFMDDKNARALLDAIHSLQSLSQADPQAIYWKYIGQRACRLEAPFVSRENLVLARLMCLTRSHSWKEYESINLDWSELDDRVKHTLTKHFLADGIQENVYSFVFLPLCIANAKANESVGLTVFLTLLAHLIHKINAMLPRRPVITNIDLSELAVFIATVQHTLTLHICMDRIKLKKNGEAYAVRIRGRDWGLADEGDPEPSPAYLLHEVLRKHDNLERIVEIAKETGSSKFVL